jgi:hypothetical protein
VIAVHLPARLKRQRGGYAICPEDGFWFRPLYTGGTCPLCGASVANGSPRLPLIVRADRFWLGMAMLTLVSVGMSTLVLLMYFGV